MMDIEQIIARMAVAHSNIEARTGRNMIRTAAVAIEAGLTPEEIGAGIRELLQADEFKADPWFMNSIGLTEDDHRYAPVIGGEARHLISWDE